MFKQGPIQMVPQTLAWRWPGNDGECSLAPLQAIDLHPVVSPELQEQVASRLQAATMPSINVNRKQAMVPAPRARVCV